MKDEYLLERLLKLETQVRELTQRVYRLENARRDDVPREAFARIPDPGSGVADQISGPAPSPVPQTVTAAAAAPADPVSFLPPPGFATVEPAARSSADWETTLGGSWLNRIGAFVLVVGIALLLGYSFRHMGPMGRDAVGLGAAVAMLAGGIAYERRPRYRSFARGLIGGGWAAMYFTVYAMQALDAARVISSPLVGAVLLAAVAGGMIAHALRYRAEAVAGLAYFSAFGALALTQVTAFSLVALLPLAASLLYVAVRFRWRRLALMGVIATYVVCLSRGDTGAPLWAAQGIFAVYWLLFEGFEILAPGTWLMPLNAAGFLLLSLLKWQTADPAHVWAFLAITAAAYASGGALRAWLHPETEARKGGWHGPASAAAGLAAAAILLHLQETRALAGLLLLGEIYFLAGVRLRAGYLRFLALPLFGLELIHLFAAEAPNLPVTAWMPVAAVTAAIFYANRAICREDLHYGYAGTAVAVLIGACEAPAREVGRVWFLMAAGPFLAGWWRRLPDFRVQAYLLAGLAGFASLATAPHPPVSTAAGAVVCSALAAFALWSPEDRFVGTEQAWLFQAASTAGALLAAILLRAVLPQAWIGPAWAMEALLLAAAATRLDRAVLRGQACAAAMAAFLCAWILNLDPGAPALAAAAAIACLYGAQLATGRGDPSRPYYSLLAGVLTAALLYSRVSGSVLTVAWGLQGLALLGSGFPLRERVLRLSGLALLLACILKLFFYDLSYLDTLPRILSFLTLGVILLGVSWIYTRFRDRIQRYL